MKKLATIILVTVSTLGFSGGFQLNVQSVRAIGLGGAYVGFAKGPASVFFNPGAMPFTAGHSFNLGVSLVFPKVSLQTNQIAGDVIPYISQTSGVATPLHFYYSGRIGDKLAVGLGINNQFGSSSSFEQDWAGRFIVQNISLRTFTFQPTVAYKIADWLSFGAGFVFTTGSFSTQKAIPVGSTEFDYGQATLSGNGIAYGFNAGIFSNPIATDKINLTVGASFRSGQKIDLPDGTAQFTDIPISLQGSFPSETAFSGELNLPFVFSGGFAFTYNINESNSLTFVYDVNYTGWSSYDTLSFDFVNEDTPDSKTTKDWQNVPTFRFGIEYALNDMFFFRAGGYYDKTPIKDGFLSPELPDADQFVPTVGFGIKPTENMSFDLSWIYQNTERTGSLDAAGWDATYRRIANVISFSFTYSINNNKDKNASID